MFAHNYAEWDEISFLSRKYLYCTKGPTIAAREGLTEAADQLEWFVLEYGGPI